MFSSCSSSTAEPTEELPLLDVLLAFFCLFAWTATTFWLLGFEDGEVDSRFQLVPSFFLEELTEPRDEVSPEAPSTIAGGWGGLGSGLCGSETLTKSPSSLPSS